MRDKRSIKTKILAAAAMLAAVVGIGCALSHVEDDHFVIEAQPKKDSVNETASDAIEETIPVTVSEKDHNGETIVAAENNPNPAQSAAAEEMLIDGKVNINTANVELLSQLEGIGESTAENIIKYREENGDFQHIEELTLVNGIGQKKLDKIRDRICVK